MDYSDSNVTECVCGIAICPAGDGLTGGLFRSILQELRTLAQYQYVASPMMFVTFAQWNIVSTLVTAAHQHALRKVVDSESKSYLTCVDRLLLSLLFHCSKDENHTRAMRDVEAAFACKFPSVSNYSRRPA